jgi:hypothetical protein
MKLLILLIVTVVGSGGPSSVQRSGRPDILGNSSITVSRHVKSGMKVVAKSRDGHLRAHLRPAVYTIEAILHDSPPGPQQHLPNCEPKTIRLTRGPRTRNVDIYCSIK